MLDIEIGAIINPDESVANKLPELSIGELLDRSRSASGTCIIKEGYKPSATVIRQGYLIDIKRNNHPATTFTQT